MTYLVNLSFSLYLLTSISVVLAFVSAIRMFPVIIHTVRAKNLMDKPGGRKIHSAVIPTLGGVGLFASFSLSIILFGLIIGLDRPDLLKLLSLLGATLILLFLGIKDDLIAIPPKKKLVAQISAASIVIFAADIRITSFYGLFGVYELSFIFSVLITFFVFILVINAFNLIDGIDGLAGSVAVIGCCSFGIFFLQNGQSLMALVSFILIGATLGFLRFNLSRSAAKKLFMGDSGSMFIGFLLAYQGISFLSVNSLNNIPMPSSNAPIMLLAILSFPLVDTLRVFTIRAKEKRSPFSPDKNHIHHRLLHLGLTHRQSTSVIVAFNWIVIGMTFLIEGLNLNIQLVVFLCISGTLYLSPFSKLAERLVKSYISKKTSKVKDAKQEIVKKYDSIHILNTESTSFNQNSTNNVLNIREEKTLDNEVEVTEEINSQIHEITDKRIELLKKATMIK